MLEIRVDVYHHQTADPDLNSKLDSILTALAALRAKEDLLMADLTAIQTAVTNETTVEQSAIALLTSLSAQIASLKNDPAALQALADSINTSSTALAAAVTANTPAA